MKRSRLRPLLLLLLACAFLMHTPGAALAAVSVLPPVIGESPVRTSAEEECEALIVMDAELGTVFYEKAAETGYALSGNPVFWMTALTAADTLKMTDVLRLPGYRYSDYLVRGDKQAGLRYRQDYTVRDLMALMLVYGAKDAAIALSMETQKQLALDDPELFAAPAFTEGRPESASADANYDFTVLMNRKAAELGMTDTVYTNCYGAEDPAQVTTARDQMLLLQAITGNKTLLRLTKQLEYTLESEIKLNFSVVSDYALLNPQKTLGKATVDNEEYDARVRTLTIGSGTAGMQCIVSAETDNRDLQMVLWCPEASASDAAGIVSALIDQYSILRTLDVFPALESLVRSVSLRVNDTDVTRWSLQEDKLEVLSYPAKVTTDARGNTVYTDFTPDAAKLTLVPDLDSLTYGDDNLYVLEAAVLYNKVEIGTVHITAIRDIYNPADTNNVQYYRDNINETPKTPREQFMEEYGWIILTGSAALLCLIAIVVGSIIKSRMDD